MRQRDFQGVAAGGICPALVVGGPQIFKPAGLPISQSACLSAGRARRVGGRSAGWETRDTADLEVCGTKKAPTTLGGTRGHAAKKQRADFQ
jgi:hypothetical protein